MRRHTRGDERHERREQKMILLRLHERQQHPRQRVIIAPGFLLVAPGFFDISESAGDPDGIRLADGLRGFAAGFARVLDGWGKFFEGHGIMLMGKVMQPRFRIWGIDGKACAFARGVWRSFADFVDFGSPRS